MIDIFEEQIVVAMRPMGVKHCARALGVNLVVVDSDKDKAARKLSCLVADHVKWADRMNWSPNALGADDPNGAHNVRPKLRGVAPVETMVIGGTRCRVYSGVVGVGYNTLFPGEGSFSGRGRGSQIKSCLAN